MKIRFTVDPKGRPEFKKDMVVEFKGALDEGYARKYVARGWAVEIEEAPASEVYDVEEGISGGGASNNANEGQDGLEGGYKRRGRNRDK